jgi:hypothetical protein
MFSPLRGEPARWSAQSPASALGRVGEVACCRLVIARLQRDLFSIFGVYWSDGGMDGYRPDGSAGGSGMALQDSSRLAGATSGMATPAGVGAQSTVASGAAGLAVLGDRH